MKKQTLKDFYNPISEDNRIFTGEEIGKMSLEEFQANEDAIMYQYENLGVPYERQLKNNDDIVFVHEYKREDGTIVNAHYRSKPSNKTNNGTNKMPFSEKIIYDLSKIFGNSLFFPIAGSNLHNALGNFEEVKKNQNAHLLNSVLDIGDTNIIKNVLKANIPINTKGVYYDPESRQSKQIWQSDEIQTFIEHNKTKLINNSMPLLTDIEFKPKEFDTHLGIQKCKMFSPMITKNGYFDAILFDYYDFEHRKPNNNLDIPTYLNNWGFSMQDNGYLENYFNIYYIHERL